MLCKTNYISVIKGDTSTQPQPTYLPTYLSTYLSIYLSICLSVCLSVCLPACLSIYLSIYLSVCLSVCLSACLPACLSIYPSIYLSVCLSVCLSVYLSIYHPYIYLPILFSSTRSWFLPSFLFHCLSFFLSFSCSLRIKRTHFCHTLLTYWEQVKNSSISECKADKMDGCSPLKQEDVHIDFINS